MSQLSFNPSSVDVPAMSHEPVPPGRYTVVCEKTDVKPNKKNNGTILSLMFVIQDGEHKNRKIYENLNIQHENPKAEMIGQQMLAGLCRIAEIEHLSNTAQLHGIPIEIMISVQPGDDKYPARNRVKGFIRKVEQTGGIDLTKSRNPQPSTVASIKPSSTTSIRDLDDDIPF